MAVSYDILLGADGDLPIQTNDLKLGPSDNQHIEDAISSFPGWWKEYPDNGVGIAAYQKSRLQPQTLLNKIKQQLGNDGYTLDNPQVNIVSGIMEIVLSNPATNTFIYKQ